jgi:two-component SAPR family response regulator
MHSAELLPEMTVLSAAPMLVVGLDPTLGGSIVTLLRRLGHIAVWVDAPHSAIEILETVECRLVFAIVEHDTDWQMASRLARTGHCKVAIVTRFLAANRRYRDRAFRAGVAAYLSLPCTVERLREAVERLERGDAAIELVAGAPYWEG